MRIGEMTQGNQNQYLELLKSLNKKGALASKNSNTVSGALGDDQSARYADRFTPAPEIKFVWPDWNKIPTKKTPAMSEDAFVDAIRELAKKNYVEGNIGGKEYESLASNYIKAASPDRKALYENSMAQTGGYMNKGQSFFDASGQQVMYYSTTKNVYIATITVAERSRMQQFVAIYNEQWNALYKEEHNTTEDVFPLAYDKRI